MAKFIVKSLDNLSLLEIIGFIRSCDEKFKYAKYPNLRAAWEAVIENGQYETLCSTIDLKYPGDAPPKEAVAVVKSLLRPGKWSDKKVEDLLRQSIPYGVYKASITGNRPKREAEYKAFRKALVVYLNKNWSRRGFKFNDNKVKRSK